MKEKAKDMAKKLNDYYESKKDMFICLESEIVLTKGRKREFWKAVKEQLKNGNE